MQFNWRSNIWLLFSIPLYRHFCKQSKIFTMRWTWFRKTIKKMKRNKQCDWKLEKKLKLEKVLNYAQKLFGKGLTVLRNDWLNDWMKIQFWLNQKINQSLENFCSKAYPLSKLWLSKKNHRSNFALQFNCDGFNFQWSRKIRRRSTAHDY